MDNLQKQYYYEMAKKDRLFLFYHNERKICLITFYMGNEDTKFTRPNMWQVLNDDNDGSVCWIDHLLTDKSGINPKLSYRIWHYFKEHIRIHFPQVKEIRWNRAKKDPLTGIRKVRSYVKSMGEGVCT